MCIENQLPDFTNLIAVHKFIHENRTERGAAAFIGAGFSRNALNISDRQPANFPTWKDLSREMSIRLRENPDTDPRVIAQSFDETFGRVELERLLLESIPDMQAEPDEHHRLLLELPWRDVFTTNFDTLLERAVPGLSSGQTYRIVNSVREIPGGNVPRIIKAHGSFPSIRPFIITSEDFANYPRVFAPYVNLMRQAFMENALVVFGFSMEDPNFEEWRNWVQTELQTYAPYIYLCGVLDLDLSTKADYKKKGIQTVDVGPLFPKHSIPEAQRHFLGNLWLLRTLSQNASPLPSSWPSESIEEPSFPKREIPDLLILKKQWSKVVFPSPKPVGESESISSSTINELIQQDLECPRWIIAPKVVRNKIMRTLSNLEPVNPTTIKDLSEYEKVLLLDSICFKKDIELKPLDKSEAEVIEQLLDDTNSIHTNCRITATQKQKIAEAWIRLSLSILRMYRQDNVESKFTKWTKIVLELIRYYPNHLTEINYQTALWYLQNCELDKFISHLLHWRETETSAWGKVKLAAFFGECGDYTSSSGLLDPAINSILLSFHNDRQNTLLLTQLSWARFIQQHIVHLKKLSFGQSKINDVFSDLLEFHKCEPYRLIKELSNDLIEATNEQRPGESLIRRFDPNTIQKQIHMGEDKLISKALSILLFLENTGIPHSVPATFQINPLTKITRTLLLNAHPASPYWVLNSFLRTAGNDDEKILDTFYTRNFIFAADKNWISSTTKILFRALYQSIQYLIISNDLPQYSSFYSRYLIGSLEFLSRLLFRLDIEKKEAAGIIVKILSHIEINLLEEIKPSLANFVNRFVECAEPELLLEYFSDFLDLPVRQKDRTESMFPDPLITLRSKQGKSEIVTKSLKYEHRGNSISNLLEFLSSKDHGIRSTAAIRLSYLHDAKLFTSSEVQKFREALLTQIDPRTSIPINTTLHSLYLVDLVELDEGTVWDTIKTNWLSLDFPKIIEKTGSQETFFTGRIDEVADLLTEFSAFFTKYGDHSSSFTSGELKNLLLNLRSHVLLPLKGISDNMYKSIFNRSLFELKSAVHRYVENVIIPCWAASVDESFPQEDMNLIVDVGAYTIGTSIGLLCMRDSDPTQVMEKIGELLSSSQIGEVNEGVVGAYRWIRNQDKRNLPNRSNELLSLLIERARWMSEPGLGINLDAISSLLNNNPEEFSSEQKATVLRTLAALHVRYIDSGKELILNAQTDDYNIVARAAHLARICRQRLDCGLDFSAAEKWIDYSLKCCLPEVRWND